MNMYIMLNLVHNLLFIFGLFLSENKIINEGSVFLYLAIENIKTSHI